MEDSSDYMLPQRLQIQTLGSASKLLGILSNRGLEYWCFRSRSSRSKGMPFQENTFTQGQADYIFLEVFSG